MAGYNTSINTNNTLLNILTNGGVLNIATDTASITTIGKTSGASQLILNAGSGNMSLNTGASGDISISSAQNFSIDAVGTLEANSSAGIISIGNDANNFAVNLGTGGTRHVTLGSTASTSQTTLQAGSTGINITGFAEGALVTDASGVISTTTATLGYILTSQGAGNAPIFAPNAAAPFVWNEQNTTPFALASDNGYIMDAGATPMDCNLPNTANVGDTIIVQGYGSGLWTIAMGVNQVIHFGAIDTTPSTGSLSSTGRYDSVSMVCVVQDLEWAVYASVGVLAYV